MKNLMKLTHNRIILLSGFALSIVSMLLSQTPMQDLVSSNATVEHIEEVTKMPFWFLVGLTVLVVTIFAYLWINAGKEDNMDTLIRKMESLNRKVNRIERKLGHKKLR